jgi:hypothetical protein
MTRKMRILIGIAVVCAAAFALSQCIVLDRRPVVQVKEKEKEKRRPPGPAYRVGMTLVVTGTVRGRGNAFLLDDDSSDFLFQFAGVRFDEKAALQRAMNRHVSVQLRITGQQGARVFIADFISITG